MYEVITEDLARFGLGEMKRAYNLLKAWYEYGVPEDFYQSRVLINFNFYSGEVFLSNSDHQVLMLEDEKLGLYYSCPECGYEGFKAEMLENALSNT
ncbi:MAG: hypothetical protein RLN62_02550 [Rickettsiales bacterium]